MNTCDGIGLQPFHQSIWAICLLRGIPYTTRERLVETESRTKDALVESGMLLAAISSDQEEYIGAVALVVMLCIGCGSEVSCFDDDSYVGRVVEESYTRCVVAHYFQTEIQDCFGIVGVPGGVSARGFDMTRGSHVGGILRFLSELRDIWSCLVPLGRSLK